jgi:hypothetical protein
VGLPLTYETVLSWNSTSGVAGKINPIFGSGKGNGLHLVPLIASIIVDDRALGIIGMIIAVPTITILQRIAKLLLERRRYPAHVLDFPPEQQRFGTVIRVLR